MKTVAVIVAPRTSPFSLEVMKTFFFPLFIASLLINVLLPAPGHAAQSFDTDVFGTYVGFTNGNSFRLRFSSDLRISNKYRTKRIRVREDYRLLESGYFTGILRIRGRAAATMSGRWSNTPRSIRASGKVRAYTGKQQRFSIRMTFGPGTIAVTSRAAGSVIRASGVKP